MSFSNRPTHGKCNFPICFFNITRQAGSKTSSSLIGRGLINPLLLKAEWKEKTKRFYPTPLTAKPVSKVTPKNASKIYKGNLLEGVKVKNITVIEQKVMKRRWKFDFTKRRGVHWVNMYSIAYIYFFKTVRYTDHSFVFNITLLKRYTKTVLLKQVIAPEECNPIIWSFPTAFPKCQANHHNNIFKTGCLPNKHFPDSYERYTRYI